MIRWWKRRAAGEATGSEAAPSEGEARRPSTDTSQRGPVSVPLEAGDRASASGTYPHDQPGFSAVQRELLACLRVGKPWTPVRAISQHIREDMPDDLKALLHTFACHGGLIDLGAWVIEVRALDESVDEWIENAELPEAERAGLDPRYAICIGHDARGRRPLLATFVPPQHDRMRFVGIDVEERTTIHFGALDALVRRVYAEHERVFGAGAGVPGLLERLAEVERAHRRSPTRF